MKKNHVKRCLTSLVITEMKIKNKMRYHIYPPKSSNEKDGKISNHVKTMKLLELPYTAIENVNFYKYYGKLFSTTF